MPPRKTKTSLSKLTWAVILMVMIVPIIFASISPLLAWRDPIYIVAGFAGILAMSLLFIQPLAIGGDLPNLHPIQQRRLHRWGGSLLFVLIVLHVVGLWITSPPDMIDALLFSAPTLFSYFGVIAMWAIFAAVILAFLRKRPRPAELARNPFHTGGDHHHHQHPPRRDDRGYHGTHHQSSVVCFCGTNVGKGDRCTIVEVGGKPPLDFLHKAHPQGWSVRDGAMSTV